MNTNITDLIAEVKDINKVYPLENINDVASAIASIEDYNYRIVKTKDFGKVSYGIYEVYYDVAGFPITFTYDPITFEATDDDDDYEYELYLFRQALTLPVLDATMLSGRIV